MKKYCEECEKVVLTSIVEKTETYDVCGESIEVQAQVLICAECGEELFCEELDNATLVKAYNEYRRRHKLLLPEEIKAIRVQYGLSQRGFAKLLNWGDKTIARYENGSLQDRAHNSLLLFLRKPQNMKSYILENEIDVNERRIERLLKVVEILEHATGKDLTGDSALQGQYEKYRADVEARKVVDLFIKGKLSKTDAIEEMHVSTEEFDKAVEEYRKTAV